MHLVQVGKGFRVQRLAGHEQFGCRVLWAFLFCGLAHDQCERCGILSVRFCHYCSNVDEEDRLIFLQSRHVSLCAGMNVVKLLLRGGAMTCNARVYLRMSTAKEERASADLSILFLFAIMVVVVMLSLCLPICFLAVLPTPF